MNLLVCVTKTPDPTSKISFTEDNSFNSDGVTFMMNPYDEWYALVRALELKEQHGGTVTIINVGTADNDIVIRKGLAIGADDAVRIDLNPTSSKEVAQQIYNYAKDKSYDIVFCGKETIDYNGAEVGGMIAALMDVPFLSFASKLEHDGSVATVERDIEGGVEIATVNGPFVLSAAKGLAEQKIPNMRGIMMAKRKPLEVVPPQDISADVKTVGYSFPNAKAGVKMIDPENMEELVRLLHEEAKVI
jgi:electron transfer flavoprotein beta subunit